MPALLVAAVLAKRFGDVQMFISHRQGKRSRAEIGLDIDLGFVRQQQFDNFFVALRRGAVRHASDRLSFDTAAMFQEELTVTSDREQSPSYHGLPKGIGRSDGSL